MESTASSSSHPSGPAEAAGANKPRMDPRLLMALRTGDVESLDKLLGPTDDGRYVRIQVGEEEQRGGGSAPAVGIGGAGGGGRGRGVASGASLLTGVTFDSQEDSALHVVAASGDSDNYLDCAKKIYKSAKHLVKEGNKNGDTPLHCAARAGNRRMVGHLIGLVKEAAAAEAAAASASDSNSNSNNSSRIKLLLRKENDMWETVLHSAIRSRDLELIRRLLQEDPDLAGFPQHQDHTTWSKEKHAHATSPLYLAISSHLRMHRVRQLFGLFAGRTLTTFGPHGQNVLHIAVSRDVFHGKVLQDVLEWVPHVKELTEQADDIHGNTPLHLAASKDTWDKTLLIVFLYTVGLHIAYPFCILPYMPMHGPTSVLIKANEATVFQPDNEGSYPIHVAAASGRIKATVVMIERFPSCAVLCDGSGRTFLHVSVQKNMWVIVGYACHHPKLGSVLNMQDSDGNTALHLAVLGGNQWIFRYLFQNRQVLLDIPNIQGRTALDLAWLQIPARGWFYHRLNPRYFIYRVLRIARAPPGAINRTDQLEDSYMTTRDDEIAEDRRYSENMTKGSQVMGLLAVLITSATFAVAFNLPGGRRPAAGSGAVGSSHDGETPWLAGTYAFDAFVVSIALAFTCALLATIGLIYSGFDSIDYTVRKFYFNKSYWLMQSSARSLAVAFGFGIYLVMHPVSPRIATAVCVIVFGALVFQNFEICQGVILLNTIRIRLGLWAALRLPILGPWEAVVPLPLLLVVQKFWSLLVIFLLPLPWISFFNHQAFIAVEILVLVPLLYWAFLKIIFWRFWNWLC